MDCRELSCGGRINYLTGKIIGFVVLNVADAWNILIRGLGHTSLSGTVAPYLWYDQQCGQFKFLDKKDGFSLSVQLTSFQNSVQPLPGGPLISQDALGRTADMDSAYRMIAYGLVSKLKKILTNSALYNRKVRHIPKWPDIVSLNASTPDGLPYVFAEFDDKTMNTLGINKPVPLPLSIISVENTSTHTAGQAPLLKGQGIDRTSAFQRPGKQK